MRRHGLQDAWQESANLFEHTCASECHNLSVYWTAFKQTRESALGFFPNNEILFVFNEGSNGIFKDPSDLLPGSQRVAVGLARIAATV